MTPLIRYTLLQIPGWLILAGLLWLAVSHNWMENWIAAAIMTAWLIKDAALYPLCKPAFEAGPAIGPKALIGREAEVVHTLAPEGQVKLGGERWLARTHGNATIPVGQRVLVTDTDGLVLIVESAT